MKIIGHRGAAGYLPENTLASIKKAIELNVDMVEIDVQMSRDGIVIVLHDRTLDRTTDGKGEVGKMDFNEIRKFNAGTCFEGFVGNELIPTLEEVIQLVLGKAELLIEIKDGNSVYPEIEKKIVDLIHTYKAQDWCIVQSFRDAVLFRVHQVDSDIRLHKLLVWKSRWLPVQFDTKLTHFSFPKYDFVESYNLNYKKLNPGFILEAHQKGKTVFAWTVNELADIQKMKEMGVDGIISNFPDRCF
jgi:glycerophosphoryl diester phosphodiesterase